MFPTLDWQQLVHDPRFWSVRYDSRGDYEFPGTTWHESISWYKQMMAEAKATHQTDDEEEMEEGWTVSLLFPEDFVWQIDDTSEDEMNIATYHTLHHPTFYPESVYPEGALIAEEGPDDHLPGLRWTELKQMGTCLARNWQGDFDVNAVVPLLYPLVEYITFDELEDVRHTLGSTWQRLGVLDASQSDQWLAQIIIVHDNGQYLWFDEQKWKTFAKAAFKGALWIREDEDWKTPCERSLRNFHEDSHHFLPFFSMLERYA